MPLLNARPQSPVAFLLTASPLGQLGRADLAETGFKLCVERSVDTGNLPIAVTACIEMRELGMDSNAELDLVAGAFALGSPRLSGDRMAPPALPGRAEELEPLLDSLGGARLVAEAERALKRAQQTGKAETTRVRLAPQPLFSSLRFRALRALSAIFELYRAAKGESVIKEGSTGEHAYVVARGELEVIRTGPTSGRTPGSGQMLARLGSGALFGEMALLSRAPRAASVIAVRPSLLLVAGKPALDQLAAQEPEVGRVFAEHCRRRMLENLLRTSAILQVVSRREQSALMARFVPRSFEPSEKIIEQGQESDGLHLLASGEVKVMHHSDADTTLVSKLGAGEVVGEIALVLRRPATADVVAAQPTITMHLPRDRFLDLIRSHPKLLTELYDLAVQRDQEISSVIAQQATQVDESVLV
ncbi:MAG TPA: cyclic nucleotide-binding domain-containing protein [Polyangiaceae bacterium]